MGDFYCIFCSGEYNQIMDKKITMDLIRKANDRTRAELSGKSPDEIHEYVLEKIKNTPYGRSLLDAMANYWRDRYPKYSKVFERLYQDLGKREK